MRIKLSYFSTFLFITTIVIPSLNINNGAFEKKKTQTNQTTIKICKRQRHVTELKSSYRHTTDLFNILKKQILKTNLTIEIENKSSYNFSLYYSNFDVYGQKHSNLTFKSNLPQFHQADNHVNVGFSLISGLSVNIKSLQGKASLQLKKIDALDFSKISPISVGYCIAASGTKLNPTIKFNQLFSYRDAPNEQKTREIGHFMVHNSNKNVPGFLNNFGGILAIIIVAALILVTLSLMYKFSTLNESNDSLYTSATDSKKVSSENQSDFVDELGLQNEKSENNLPADELSIYDRHKDIKQEARNVRRDIANEEQYDSLLEIQEHNSNITLTKLISEQQTQYRIESAEIRGKMDVIQGQISQEQARHNETLRDLNQAIKQTADSSAQVDKSSHELETLEASITQKNAEIERLTDSVARTDTLIDEQAKKLAAAEKLWGSTDSARSYLSSVEKQAQVLGNEEWYWMCWTKESKEEIASSFSQPQDAFPIRELRVIRGDEISMQKPLEIDTTKLNGENLIQYNNKLQEQSLYFRSKPPSELADFIKQINDYQTPNPQLYKFWLETKDLNFFELYSCVMKK